jgi:hypothetical protein
MRSQSYKRTVSIKRIRFSKKRKKQIKILQSPCRSSEEQKKLSILSSLLISKSFLVCNKLLTLLD